MAREYHYWYDTGRGEYWESIAGGDWYQVDNAIGDDWSIESYSYIRWNENSGAVAKKGLPPRVWI